MNATVAFVDPERGVIRLQGDPHQMPRDMECVHCVTLFTDKPRVVLVHAAPAQAMALAKIKSELQQRNETLQRRAAKLRRIARRLKRLRDMLHGELWPALIFGALIAAVLTAQSFHHWLPVYVGGLLK